jgi:hypothetical protein
MMKDRKSKTDFRRSDMAEEKKTVKMTGEECSEVSGGIDLGGKGYHVFGPNGERIRYNKKKDAEQKAKEIGGTVRYIPF